MPGFTCMMRFFCGMLLLVFYANTHGVAQISLEDSTAQSIAYWQLGEKRTYHLVYKVYQVQQGDTVKRNKITFDIDFEVLDESDSSYTIDWSYHNYKTDTTNPIKVDLAKLNESLTYIIKTDEYGTFKELLNWEALRDETVQFLDGLREKYDTVQGAKRRFFDIERKLQTQNKMEQNLIPDVLQFFFFYGIKAKLGKVFKSTLNTIDEINEEGYIEAEAEFFLSELLQEEDAYTFAYYEKADSLQSTDALYKALKNDPEGTYRNLLREQVPTAIQTKLRTCKLDSSTGWLRQSLETTKVYIKASDSLLIKERLIKLK